MTTWPANLLEVNRTNTTHLQQICWRFFRLHKCSLQYFKLLYYAYCNVFLLFHAK